MQGKDGAASPVGSIPARCIRNRDFFIGFFLQRYKRGRMWFYLAALVPACRGTTVADVPRSKAGYLKVRAMHATANHAWTFIDLPAPLHCMRTLGAASDVGPFSIHNGRRDAE